MKLTSKQKHDRDAKAFADLAKEITAGLRQGKYDRVKITFNESRRKAVEAVTPKGKRSPIDLEITYAGRPRVLAVERRGRLLN